MYKECVEPLLGKQFIAKIEGDTVTYFSEESPLWAEYLAWVAEGNTAEEWSAE